MKRRCDHCHLEYDEDALFCEEAKEGKLYFCCKGCQGVYHLLQNSDLAGFYEKLGNQHLAPPKENLPDSRQFDSDAFMKQYVIQKDGLCRISLVIEGIHCAACVWLNEKILHKEAGILEAQINYTNNKATILWDNTEVKLSRIIELIRAIGYDAHPYDPMAQEARANNERREYYTRVVVGIFCTMNIMWIAIAQYAGYFSGMDARVRHILDFASFILATPALFYSGWIFFRGAYFGLKNGLITMDLLISSGASLGYFYSIYAALTQRGETYFESVTMIITFVLIGKFLEIKGKKAAADSLDRLSAQIPRAIRVIRDGIAVQVTPTEVRIGEVIEVLAGERIALDGELLSERALCDESLISGESLPVQKRAGEVISSGAINLLYPMRYRATHLLGDSLISNIIRLIEESLSKKPKIEQRANELSRHFSAMILLLALLSFAAHFWLFEASFERALVIGISVIIIACPCALALATPIASLVGVGESLKRKLLFKEARFLESIAKADVLVVDKTGTLTLGRPKVVQTRYFGAFDEGLLLELVAHSNHPISAAITGFLKDKGVAPLAQLEGFSQLDSRGILAKVQNSGAMIAGGSLEFMRELGVDLAGATECERTCFAFALAGELVAIFELEDPIKPHAKEAISGIEAFGVRVIMLTGDHQKIAQKVAQNVGIAEVHAGLNPLQKAEFIARLHEKSHIVVMAGDGINDAPALAKSDISLAMGRGTDVAIGVSDVVLLDDSLNALYESFNISRKTYHFIKQNLAISLIYNTLTIPLAMAGYVIPLIAAASMSLSSLLVVGNSMRIRR